MMPPNKFNIFLLPVIARICTAGIIPKSTASQRDIKIDKATIDVIKSCYENRGHAVGVAGTHISENLIHALSSERIPVVLIENSTRTQVEFYQYHRKFRYNLQVFVLDISTLEELEKVSKGIFKSVWWNHMASFLIIYRSSVGCVGSTGMMYLAWRYQMFNTKTMCFINNENLIVVTYNPYTSYAPKPWVFLAAYKVHNTPNNRFAVFMRPYDEGKEICDNLDFDAAKNLYGYPIELLFTFNGVKTYLKKSKTRYLNQEHGMINHVVNIFIRHVNGTRVDKQIDTSKVGSHAILNDMVLSKGTMESGTWNPVSRPFFETGLLVMTQHRGYKSPLQKVVSVVDVYSNIGVCIVLAVTLIFFKFVAGQTFGSAFLNIVRIVCDTGFENLPIDTPIRLYVTTVLLFAVTMQGIYQGNLAALLTNGVPLRNVITWQDLVDLGHTVYIGAGTMQMFYEPEFAGRVIDVNWKGDCAEYVVNNSSAACLGPANFLRAQATIWNLHLSIVLKPTLVGYQHRPDWALEWQLNSFLGKIFEADLVLPLNLRMHRNKLFYDDPAYAKPEENETIIRVMTLTDLTFAFVILGIGLLCASVTFVFEIVIHQICAQIKKRQGAVRPFVVPHRR